MRPPLWIKFKFTFVFFRCSSIAYACQWILFIQLRYTPSASIHMHMAYMNHSTIFCCISNMHWTYFWRLILFRPTFIRLVFVKLSSASVSELKFERERWMNTKFITLTNECGAISLVKNRVNCVRMCAENRLTWFIHFSCCFQFESEKMRQWTIFCQEKRIEDIFIFHFHCKVCRNSSRQQSLE